MIYIVGFDRDEVLLNRIGDQELQYYTNLRHFLPLLEKRATVVQVDRVDRQIDSVYEFARYVGEEVVYLSFSVPSDAYDQLQCRKYVFPDSIPPPVWDQYSQLAIEQTTASVVKTSGAVVDSTLDGLLPKSEVRYMPWGRSISASWLALKRLDFRLALYYLVRRKSVHYYPRQLLLDGVVYTTLIAAERDFDSWKQMIADFSTALSDKADATLVVKLFGRVNKGVVKKAVRMIKRQTVQCRIVLISEHLPQEEYEKLVQATSFYIPLEAQGKFGKPVLEFMSASKPLIASVNEIKRYADTDQKILIDCSKNGLGTAFRESYTLYKEESDHYRQMAIAASQDMRAYCSLAVVEPMLNKWLDTLDAESPRS